ncbi:MAG: hypothetical protein QXQ91_02645 [Nanopusillaceae archaeon]
MARRKEKEEKKIEIEDLLKMVKYVFATKFTLESSVSVRNILDILSTRDDIQKLETMINNRFAPRVETECPQGHITVLYIEGRGKLKLKVEKRKYEEVVKAVLEGRSPGSIQCPYCGLPATVKFVEPSKLMIEGVFSLLRATEETIDAYLEAYVKKHPVWTWARYVKGLGPANTARLIAVIETSKSNKVADMWMRAGLAPVAVCGNKCGWWTKAPFPEKCPKCGGPVVKVAPTKLVAKIYNVWFKVDYRLMKHMYVLSNYYLLMGRNFVYGIIAQQKMKKEIEKRKASGLDEKIATARATKATWRWLARMMLEHAKAAIEILRGTYQGPPPPVLRHGQYIPPLVDDVERAERDPDFQKIAEWYRKHMDIDILEYSLQLKK